MWHLIWNISFEIRLRYESRRRHIRCPRTILFFLIDERNTPAKNQFHSRPFGKYFMYVLRAVLETSYELHLADFFWPAHFFFSSRSPKIRIRQPDGVYRKKKILILFIYYGRALIFRTYLSRSSSVEVQIFKTFFKKPPPLLSFSQFLLNIRGRQKKSLVSGQTNTDVFV